MPSSGNAIIALGKSRERATLKSQVRDGGWRLRGRVVKAPVDTFELSYSLADFFEFVPRQFRDGGSSGIGTFHTADYNNLAECMPVAWSFSKTAIY